MRCRPEIRRGARCGGVRGDDSANDKTLYIYRLLVHDKLIQALPEVRSAQESMRHKLAFWYAKQLPKGHPILWKRPEKWIFRLSAEPNRWMNITAPVRAIIFFEPRLLDQVRGNHSIDDTQYLPHPTRVAVLAAAAWGMVRVLAILRLYTVYRVAARS